MLSTKRELAEIAARFAALPKISNELIDRFGTDPTKVATGQGRRARPPPLTAVGTLGNSTNGKTVFVVGDPPRVEILAFAVGRFDRS